MLFSGANNRDGAWAWLASQSLYSEIRRIRNIAPIIDGTKTSFRGYIRGNCSLRDVRERGEAGFSSTPLIALDVALGHPSPTRCLRFGFSVAMDVRRAWRGVGAPLRTGRGQRSGANISGRGGYRHRSNHPHEIAAPRLWRGIAVARMRGPR